jgi:hypothetical protein
MGDLEVKDRDLWVQDRDLQVQVRDLQVKERDPQVKVRDPQVQDRDLWVQERDLQVQVRDLQVRERNSQVVMPAPRVGSPTTQSLWMARWVGLRLSFRPVTRSSWRKLMEASRQECRENRCRGQVIMSPWTFPRTSRLTRFADLSP